MPHPLPLRLKHAWAVASGKIVLPAQTEGLELMTLLTNTMTTIAALDAGADRLIAANAGNATALTQAQVDLANVDTTVNEALQPVLAKVVAATPVPVSADSADASANADSSVTGDAAPTSGTSTADAPSA